MGFKFEDVRAIASSLIPNGKVDESLVFEVNFTEEGKIECDVVTILFGMGIEARSHIIYIPHSNNQHTYDTLLTAAVVAADILAGEHYKGNWQIWEIRQDEVEKEKVEQMFLSRMIPLNRSGESKQPSQT